IDFEARFPSLPLISNDAGQDLFATDSDLIPELLPNADGFNESPRLADLLLAWGIGPAYAPDPTRNANDVQFDSDENDRWMTLSEALAIGLGFQTAGITYDSTAQEVDTVWADTTSANESLFDNGHLSLKSFVPYFNNTLEAVGEVPVFNFDTDIRRGLGIPMALGVLDQARAIEPILDPTATNVDPLTQSTFGQININTAPVEVLRLLPGLSPSLTSYFQNMTDNVDEWWGENEAWNLPDLSEGINQSNTSARTPDVAAALVAYRDRLQAQPRFTSTSLDGFAQANPLRYTTANIEADQHALNMVREEFPFDPTATGFDEDHRDRGTIAGVNGLRTTPGFSSIGEVLMATIDEQAQGAGLTGIPVPMRTYNAQLDIQQFGYDDLNLDGAADDIVAMDPQLFSGQSNGSTVDDYAERLALANTIANSITVRSDYFAAWFVIHAYQEADVTNLQPEDPLVPSVAKRYVMVVDRTNVVNPGDTPKIVFIREVPM
ncbi:MAG: hypothetical protein AB8C13_09590, partial [Phycisphaerales bacterium]